MSEHLLEFSDALKTLLKQADVCTSSTCKSIDFLHNEISIQHSNVDYIFKVINSKESAKKNIDLCQNELDNLLDLFHLIDTDQLDINKGPMGQVGTYLTSLERLKTVESYSWIQQLKYSQNVRIKIRESDLKAYYYKYKLLIRVGENFLCQEFASIMNHFSSSEQMQFFFDFLLNKFEANAACSLYLSNETLAKLESICSWFLEREQQYELFNEKMEHCDINQKLNFSEYRNDFLKQCLNTFFKMNSIGNSATNSRHNLKEVELNEQVLCKLIKSAQSKEGDGQSPTSSFTFELNSKNSKPVELIEIFAQNLDFCLKLLKHDHELIQRIYARSEITRNELISKLTVMIIDSMQKEFEKFFTHKLDFTRLSNNGNHVVLAITNLIIRVQNLKEKSKCLQTEDLTSTSKLLIFSLKLNEIGAQIFTTYLDVVKQGLFDKEESFIWDNCSIHLDCRKVCDLWKCLHSNESFLLDSIKNVSSSSHVLSVSRTNTSNSTKDLIIQTHKVNRRVAKTSIKSNYTKKNNQDNCNKDKENENDDDDKIIDEDEELKNFQRSRRANRNIDCELFNSETSKDNEENDSFNSNLEDENQTEELETSTKFCFGKYYTLLFENLVHFLQTETNRLSQKMSSLSSYSQNFRNHLNNFKKSVFLANNLQYIYDLCDSSDLFQYMNRVDSHFESNLKLSIQSSINKSCNLLGYMNTKWIKCSNLEANNSNENKTRKRVNSLSSSSSASSSYKPNKYKFGGSKKKYQNEFMSMLKVCLDQFMRIRIDNEQLRLDLCSKIEDYLTEALTSLEYSGELERLIQSFDNSKIVRNDLLSGKLFFCGIFS